MLIEGFVITNRIKDKMIFKLYFHLWDNLQVGGKINISAKSLIFTLKPLLLLCILNNPCKEQSWQYVWHFGGCCCLKTEVDNHLLIILPLLVSAYRESGYEPGRPAAHEYSSDVIMHHFFFFSLTSCTWSNITQLIVYSIWNLYAVELL